jgi:hypothetical protein
MYRNIYDKIWSIGYKKMRDREMLTANYHCPICETLSAMILGPEQAFCTDDKCNVICWNPSLPDRGMSDGYIVDFDLGEK